MNVADRMNALVWSMRRISNLAAGAGEDDVWATLEEIGALADDALAEAETETER